MVRFKACALAAAVSAFLLCGRLDAQVTWNGSEDTNWSDLLNWTGTPLFDGTDQLVFSSASSMTSDVNNTYSVTSLTIANGSGPLLLESNEGSVLSISTGLFDNSASAVSISVSLSGSGYVQSDGNGTLTLSGNNSYSGGTMIDSGTLVIGSNTALGSGAVTMASGTNLTTTGSGPFAITSAFTLTGGPVTLLGGNAGATLELDGVVSGAGGLSIAAGSEGQNVVTLTSGASVFGGGVSVAPGNTGLVIGASSTGTGSNVTQVRRHRQAHAERRKQPHHGRQQRLHDRQQHLPGRRAPSRPFGNGWERC